MKQATMHIENTKQIVRTNYSSVFSKDDVVRLLNELAERIEKDDDVINAKDYTESILSNCSPNGLADKINEAVSDRVSGFDWDDLVDNFSFKLEYVENITVDTCSVKDKYISNELKEVITTAISNYYADVNSNNNFRETSGSTADLKLTTGNIHHTHSNTTTKIIATNNEFVMPETPEQE